MFRRVTETVPIAEQEADRAAARGDRAAARALLVQVTREDPGRMGPWLKLAAICRAEGDVPAALAAVSGALTVEPLDFVALLLKATLLEAAGLSSQAGEAYGHALAQRPPDTPPHLAVPLARAETLYEEHRQRLVDRLDAAVAPVSERLDEAERARIARFSSNIARRTRVWHSDPTHFHYPGLVEREFHERADFPWLARLEAAAPVIRAEFESLVASSRAELVPYIQYPDDQPLRQWRALNHNADWSAIHLIVNGAPVAANAEACPETMRLLAGFGQPAIAGLSPNAMFSLLAPGTRIPPHHGVANTRLVCHLPLIVPDRCWFRCGAETREWRHGEAFVFDDTIEHEAANDSDELRVVFIFDVWHPGLAAAERDAVAALVVASGIGGTEL